HHIKAEGFSLPLTIDTHSQIRVGGARGGNAGVAKKFVGQRVAHKRVIIDKIVKVKLIGAAELLTFCKSIDVHFERALPSVERREIRSIAFEARRDICEWHAAEFEIRVCPIEFEAQHSGQSAASGFWMTQQYRSIWLKEMRQRGNALWLQRLPLV